jgi:hypothetical protein
MGVGGGPFGDIDPPLQPSNEGKKLLIWNSIQALILFSTLSG